MRTEQHFGCIGDGAKMPERLARQDFKMLGRVIIDEGIGLLDRGISSTPPRGPEITAWL